MGLPTHNHVHYTSSALGPAYGAVTRYVVQSPDVLEMKPGDESDAVKMVEVREEETGKLVWIQVGSGCFYGWAGCDVEIVGEGVDGDRDRGFVVACCISP